MARPRRDPPCGEAGGRYATGAVPRRVHDARGEQMSIEKTAAALAISAATVKTRLHRANEQLRAVLGGTFAAILEDPSRSAGCAVHGQPMPR